MALKPCRECGTDVSSGAAVCPHCGVKNPVRGSSGLNKGCLFLIAAVLILAAIGQSIGKNDAARAKVAEPITRSGPIGGLGISRAHLAALFPTVQFEARTLKDGRASFLGRSADGFTAIEMTGPEVAPTVITLLSAGGKDRPDTAVTALANGLVIVRVATGDSNCAGPYVRAFKGIGQGEQTLSCNGRLIALKPLKSLGLISTSITMP